MRDKPGISGVNRKNGEKISIKENKSSFDGQTIIKKNEIYFS